MDGRTDKLSIHHLEALHAAQEPDPTIPFGDWLVRRGLIDRGQLFAALNLSFNKGFRVGDALVSLGLLQRQMVEDEARRHRAFRSFVGLI